MKVYKKIMDGLAGIEKLVAIIVSIIVTAITFVNVLSRYVFHASISWSEELVINLFILLIMVGCSLCIRDGSMISLSLIFDMLKAKGKKIFVLIITLVNSSLWILLMKTGLDKALNEMSKGKQTVSLGWPQWVFTIILPIGATLLLLHTIEFCVDVMRGEAACVKDSANDQGGND